ncbi:MAG TPA: flagellar motor protein MotA [Stellaceae bacterium]|nr:flagellar motor protein MotA [Stellaceae bacterium]
MRRVHSFIVRMGVFVVLVAALAVVLGRPLLAAFMGNPAVNGLIFGILIAGIAYIFRQVLLLEPESDWIESFRERLANRDLTAPPGAAPRLLAPMARMLGSRQSGRVSLSATSLRTLLDGIAARLDEARETSRYLIGVLVFLGLLGTFYGLLETVRSVGNVIGTLNVGGGGDLTRAFTDLKNGLESPLHGMSTAFSASLFGLAGSLVLGFLDLQAGQAQNRFYNDLEEWLSTYTRLSSGAFGDTGDGSMPAYLHALLEQTADSLENLQRILARSEEGRIVANNTLAGLTDRLAVLGENMKAGQVLMVPLAENQLELKPSLTRLATIAENSLGQDDVLRTHLRNIEAYIARLTEDSSEGRVNTVQEIRGEIRLLARTIAALAEEGSR